MSVFVELYAWKLYFKNFLGFQEFCIDPVNRYLPPHFVTERGFYFSNPVKHSLDGAFAARLIRATWNKSECQKSTLFLKLLHHRNWSIRKQINSETVQRFKLAPESMNPSGNKTNNAERGARIKLMNLFDKLSSMDFDVGRWYSTNESC